MYFSRYLFDKCVAQAIAKNADNHIIEYHEFSNITDGLSRLLTRIFVRVQKTNYDHKKRACIIFLLKNTRKMYEREVKNAGRIVCVPREVDRARIEVDSPLLALSCRFQNATDTGRIGSAASDVASHLVRETCINLAFVAAFSFA